MQFGEFSWTCSTTFDIFLFMVEVTILCWIQFYCLVKEAAYIATAILVSCVFLLVPCVVCSNFLPRIRTTGVKFTFKN